MSKYKNLYEALSAGEPSNNPQAENELGYIGLYQMGEAALIDNGYYSKPSKKYNNDWTGKHAINSKEDFKNNPDVQNIAVREYQKQLWSQLQSHEGQTVDGVLLTKSGILAAAHLHGAAGFKEWG